MQLPGWRIAAIGTLCLVGMLAPGCRPTSQTGQPATAASEPEATDTATVSAFVSILPQVCFVERVGGRHVRVSVLVGPGQSPFSYEPTARQMSELAKARVLFRIGVPFEEVLLPKISAAFGQLKICDTRTGITLRPIGGHESDHESHAEHEHDHEGDDPHIWLSPKLVKIQAQTICDTLCQLDPPHADDYRRNLAGFHADLDGLDARIGTALAPVKGKELFVFHPAYGYFADAYGLKQVAVEIAGKEPSAKELSALVKRARDSGARVIFVQPQFSTSSAAVVAREIGGAVVPLDPLAPDYLENLERMAVVVKEALSGE